MYGSHWEKLKRIVQLGCAGHLFSSQSWRIRKKMCLFCTCAEDANQSKMEAGTPEMAWVDLSSNSYYSHKSQAWHHRPVTPALNARHKWILKSPHRSVSLAGSASCSVRDPVSRAIKQWATESNTWRPSMAFMLVATPTLTCTLYTHTHTLTPHTREGNWGLVGDLCVWGLLLFVIFCCAVGIMKW